MMMAPLRTEWRAGTDVGAVRSLNEDSWHADAAAGLWAVADGMGGLAGGDYASRAVAAALGDVAAVADIDTLLDRAAQAIDRANAVIFAESQARGARMGSTVVALAIHGRRFGVAWVGDSRAYLLRGGRLHRLTRDHSQVQELVDRGIVAVEEAHAHPLGHVLSRAVGVEPQVEASRISDAAADGDVFLLCSDGLHGIVGDDEIAAVLASGDADPPATLIARCLDRGAPDNVTIITVALDETTQLMLRPLDEML